MAFGEWFKKIGSGISNVASTAYNKIGEAKDNTYKYLGKEFVVKPTITKSIADVGIPALSTLLKSKGGTLGYMAGHAMDFFNDRFLGGDSSNNNEKYEKLMNDYNSHIRQQQEEQLKQEKKRLKKEKKKKQKKKQKKMMEQMHQMQQMMYQNKNKRKTPIVEEVFEEDENEMKMLK